MNQSARLNFQIKPEQQLDVVIKVPNEKRGLIHGLVVNEKNCPIKDAAVMLFKSDEHDICDKLNKSKCDLEPITHTFTDECGQFLFGPLCSDISYTIKIWHNEVCTCREKIEIKLNNRCISEKKCHECESIILSPQPPTSFKLITTAEELNEIRDNLFGEYRLGNNIDLTKFLSPNGGGYNNGKGWEPIGRENFPFRGSLDGKGYKITGLWINRPESREIGLFGSLDGNIENLGVEIANSGIKGENYVGGLLGSSSNRSRITKCFVSGPVSGRHSVGGLAGLWGGILKNSYSSGKISGISSAIGGLVGFDYGSIINCFASGDVSGGSEVGGLVGFKDVGTIEKCFATGNITGSSFGIGGLAGNIGGATKLVANCYATGKVLGTSFVGGFVGSNGADIIDCYSVGFVSSLHVSIGGFAGFSENTLKNCFFDKNTSGQKIGVGIGEGHATGETTANMKKQSTFTSWNFTTVWNIEENVSYPFLRSNLPPH